MIQCTVLFQSLSNFTLELFLMKGGKLLIYVMVSKVIFSHLLGGITLCVALVIILHDINVHWKRVLS